MATPESGFTLQEGLDLADISIEQLWLEQVGLGGTVGLLETEAYVLGLLEADAYRHNLLAQALNEHFLEIGQDHPVAYYYDGAEH
jgi:hypothetical protein